MHEMVCEEDAHPEPDASEVTARTTMAGVQKPLVVCCERRNPIF